MLLLMHREYLFKKTTDIITWKISGKIISNSL